MKRKASSFQAISRDDPNIATKQCTTLPGIGHLLHELYETGQDHSLNAPIAVRSETSFVNTTTCGSKPVFRNTTPHITKTLYFPEIWVHPEDKFGQWLYADLRGLNLERWIEMTFERDLDRRACGEKVTKKSRSGSNSSSKTNNVVVERNDLAHRYCFNEPCRHKSERECRSKVDHAVQEQDRRCRHYVLLNEKQKMCSKCHFDVAANRLSDMKTMLGHRGNGNRKFNSAETGKDLQLFASLLAQKMGRWVIMALEELTYANEHGTSPRTINGSLDWNDDVKDVLPTSEAEVESLPSPPPSLSSTSTCPPRRKLPIRSRKRTPVKTAVELQPTPLSSSVTESDMDDRD